VATLLLIVMAALCCDSIHIKFVASAAFNKFLGLVPNDLGQQFWRRGNASRAKLPYILGYPFKHH
jgi:hypothetical protein